MRGFCKYGDKCFYFHEEKFDNKEKVWDICSNPQCVIERNKNHNLIDELCSSSLKIKSQSLEIEKLKLDMLVKDRTIESLQNKEMSVKKDGSSSKSLNSFYQYRRDLIEISGVNKRIHHEFVSSDNREISGVNKRIHHELVSSDNRDHEPCGSVGNLNEPCASEPCGSKKTKIDEPCGSERKIVTSQVVFGDRVIRGKIYTKEQFEAREKAMKAKRRRQTEKWIASLKQKKKWRLEMNKCV